MDPNAHLRSRSASAPVPFDLFISAFQQQQSFPLQMHQFIPSPHQFIDYSSISMKNILEPPMLSYPQSYPTSPAASQSNWNGRPRFPSGSVSYPVLPANAHKEQLVRSPREAVLHTKNPLAEKKQHPSPSRPKLHLFASRKISKTDHSAFPDPPTEWLSASSTSSSAESSSICSLAPSGNTSEFEDDSETTSSGGKSPVLFELCSSKDSDEGLGGETSACRDLSNGLKALLKVQA